MAKDKKKNEQRQDWKLHWSMDILYKVWLGVFAAIKIALGAAATVLLICFVCIFVFVGVLGDYLETDILPSAGLVLENYEMDAPSTVYSVSEDGQIKIEQELYASTDWKKAEYEEIPAALINAAIAIEDKRFYEHQGVDWFTTIKAFANMFFGDETVGGSSITQQLIKNVTGEDSVTVQRKVLEFFRATLVEKNYDKKVIIEEYLNSIYLGQGCRGVKSAAEAYFGKELQMLTIAECASLISITNNPSLFDPYSDKEFTYAGETMNGRQRNRHRQLLVLGELFNQGYITEEEYDEAVAQELVLKSSIAQEDRWVMCSNSACGYEGVRKTYTAEGSSIKCPKCGTIPEEIDNASQDVYSYFVDVVIQDVAKAMAKQDGIEEWNDAVWESYLDRISRGGYHIYSTIDTNVQAQVDRIYKDLSKIPKTRSAQQLQSAIVVIDNETGDIVAMAGGVGEEKAHFGQNRATKSKLQSGSSIKPITIYAPGFEQGTITPATVIKDLPITYEDGAWPRNDDRRYDYSYTIYGGVTSSVNAVAANTLSKIGANYGYEFAKESFGISTLVETDLQFSSLALGAQYQGVTVRDMANAFATFANDGTYRNGRTWTKVYDSKGNLVVANTQESREILSEKSVNYMNYCLTNAVNRGTGGGAAISGMNVAGKTGSTSSFRDRWFCGFTGYYTAAVWCGYDIPETINLVGGSYNPASRLWNNVMAPLHKGRKNVSLYDSGKMKTVSICLDSGEIATDACQNDPRGSRVETVSVYPEDVPTGVCDKHVAMEYCSVGQGVANEYCKHFAGVDKNVVLKPTALVKLKQSELDEILAAANYGLASTFLRNDYVYLIGDDGKDGSFKGFDNSINGGENAPYKVCTVHTKAAWEQQQATQPPATPETQDPSAPTTPTEPGSTAPTQTTAPPETAAGNSQTGNP